MTKQEIYTAGDYIQAKGSNKTYVVSQVCFYHIIVQRIDNIKQCDELGLSRKELISIIPNKDIQGKFMSADLSNELVQNAIETYEIDQIIGDESFEEMCSHF